MNWFLNRGQVLQSGLSTLEYRFPKVTIICGCDISVWVQGMLPVSGMTPQQAATAAAAAAAAMNQQAPLSLQQQEELLDVPNQRRLQLTQQAQQASWLSQPPEPAPGQLIGLDLYRALCSLLGQRYHASALTLASHPAAVACS